VLTAAGLLDVAALRYRDWPAYSAEELLALDPELIVASTGMTASICRHAGLSRLHACARPGAVLEIDSSLLASAGPSMAEAAEQLFDRAHAAAGSEQAREPEVAP
jgi:iron complex transport system substrate-binding protein